MQSPENDAGRLNDVPAIIRNASTRSTPHVGCVIVTYMPESEPLRRQIEVVSPQVDRIFLVDNGDGSNLPDLSSDIKLEIILLEANEGLARAQNVGISRARQCGMDHVLLLDQDSLPATDMVEHLLNALADLSSATIAVAAVGPQYRDERQGLPSPFVYREGWRLKERQTTPETRYVPTDFLIASGCLIPIAVLEAVGDMDETLFIDYVDIEWALRAKDQGYACFGVTSARMKHNLGDQWITFRGRRLSVHTPARHYYFARNAILIARRRWIALPWKGILLWRSLKQLILFGVVLPGRTAYFKMMMLGLWHGIVGRSGRL